MSTVRWKGATTRTDAVGGIELAYCEVGAPYPVAVLERRDAQ